MNLNAHERVGYIAKSEPEKIEIKDIGIGKLFYDEHFGLCMRIASWPPGYGGDIYFVRFGCINSGSIHSFTNMKHLVVPMNGNLTARNLV